MKTAPFILTLELNHCALTNPKVQSLKVLYGGLEYPRSELERTFDFNIDNNDGMAIKFPYYALQRMIGYTKQGALSSSYDVKNYSEDFHTIAIPLTRDQECPTGPFVPPQDFGGPIDVKLVFDSPLTEAHCLFIGFFSSASVSMSRHYMYSLDHLPSLM